MRLQDRAGPKAFGRAVSAFKAGKFETAEQHCRVTLDAEPAHFDALHLLGVVRGRRHDATDALRLFDLAASLRPRNADVQFNRGSALADLGRLDEALASFETCLDIRPDYADAFNNKGNVLARLERHDEALAAYGKAVVLKPTNAEYINNLGSTLTMLRRYDDALDCYDDALDLKPKFVDALINRARTLEQLKCFDDAVIGYEKALKATTKKLDLLERRAGALFGGERYREALLAFDQALVRYPDHAALLIGRSAPLTKLGRLDEALASLDQAETHGADPGEILIHRAYRFMDDSRLDEALISAERATVLQPENPEAHTVRGTALMGLERFPDAIDSYKRALALRPNSPGVEWNLGYLALLCGDFPAGWRGYDGRRRQEGTRWTRLDGPEWRGQDLRGKRLLLYAEQGYGDVIQFARYVGVMADRGAQVILGLVSPLAGLLRHINGDPEIALHGERTPPYHFHLPLLSVPLSLGHDEADIPGRPYIRADAARVAAWAARLPTSGFKVGIAWQGSQAIPGRSVPLAAFAPLSAIPGVRLISLQKTDGLDQLETMPPGMAIERLGPDFDARPEAFLDTAAVMMNLDLIVSCDTGIAHLAGALGCPVWIVLKHVPDWRWMMDRETSPWYPTARLFRRTKTGTWFETMDNVAAALSALLEADRRP